MSDEQEPYLSESINGAVYRRHDDGKGPVRLTRFLLSRNETAEFFGASVMTVDRWRTGGCPIYEPPTNEVGSTCKYYLPDVVDWRICINYLKSNKNPLKKKAEELNDVSTGAKGRLALAKASQAELKLSEALALVIPVEMVALAWQEAFTIVKSRALALAPFLAPRLAPAMPATKVEQIIADEVYKMLSEVAGAGLPEKLRNAVANIDGGIATAAEADHQRVGAGETQA
jgi:phage terminase Nu1 subunit (DNA packaging protein)